MQRNLIDYLPIVLREFEEFKELFKAEQKEVDELWDMIYGILNEAFIDTAENTGLRR